MNCPGCDHSDWEYPEIAMPDLQFGRLAWEGCGVLRHLSTPQPSYQASGCTLLAVFGSSKSLFRTARPSRNSPLVTLQPPYSAPSASLARILGGIITKACMNTTAPKHRLTQVDLERRTAICSVCGPTCIIVAKPDKVGRVRTYCFQKRRAVEKAYRENHPRDQRVENPNRKPRHILTNIDAENMMAACLVCGPTDIRKRIQKGHTVYICNTKKRADAHDYKISHYIPKPRKPRKPELQSRKPYKPRQFSHALTQIDDHNKTAVCLKCGPVRIRVYRTEGRIVRRCGNAQNEYINGLHQKNREFVFQYLVGHGCKRCEYNADPYKLELHKRNFHEKNLKLSRLVVLGRNSLLQVLANSDVYCADCHFLLHHEPDS